MPKFSNGKIEVTSPEHSAYVQGKLFELGYRWDGGLQTPQYTDARFLFTDKYGCITYEPDDEDYFKSKKCEQFNYRMPVSKDPLNLAGKIFKFPEDEAKSKEIQEYLFSQGYYWSGSVKNYFKVYEGYCVVFYENGEIRCTIMDSPTHTLELKVQYSLSVSKLPETVVIGGKKFLKSDYEVFLEKALNE